VGLPASVLTPGERGAGGIGNHVEEPAKASEVEASAASPGSRPTQRLPKLEPIGAPTAPPANRSTDRELPQPQAVRRQPPHPSGLPRLDRQHHGRPTSPPIPPEGQRIRRRPGHDEPGLDPDAARQTGSNPGLPEAQPPSAATTRNPSEVQQMLRRYRDAHNRGSVPDQLSNGGDHG